MKYKYILPVILGVALFTINVSAKKTNAPTEDFDIDKIVFIEEDQDWELGFDTTKYLPENFDPYSEVVSIETINFIDECDEIDLGFETIGYLPEDFDPYIQ